MRRFLATKIASPHSRVMFRCIFHGNLISLKYIYAEILQFVICILKNANDVCEIGGTSEIRGKKIPIRRENKRGESIIPLPFFSHAVPVAPADSLGFNDDIVYRS